MATRAQHSGHISYNVQSVVDAETHLIVTPDVTNQGHDQDLLTRMGKQARDVLELEKMHILADKGYFSAHEILACHEAGITATVPRSDRRAKGHFVEADFTYEPGADVYRCPAGQALTHRTTTELAGSANTALLDQRLQGVHSQGSLHNVTRAPGLTGTGTSISSLRRTAMRRGAGSPMRVGRSTVEHSFGTIKASMRHSNFLTRVLGNVGTEMARNALAYNIKRMISLIGFAGLMRAIKG